ncbi:MAG: alpha,alpha-trehalose-phosphate synthase (UDP-forming) [Gemmatimonadaceae bacterium]
MSTITDQLTEQGLILLSNREPYEHMHTPDGVVVRSPAGGLVSALDPILRKVSGTWVAWASGDADAEVTDSSGRSAVPPADPSYTLRRVWLDDADIEGFYLGFANSALWPVCHMFIQYLELRTSHWDSYRSVNARFAAAVAEEAERIGGSPMVWVQDYHFALAPALIRERVPGAMIHHFWHIPFPPPDIFRLIPLGVHDALLRGMLGNDLIEFQTEGYARNFLDTVERMLPRHQVDKEAGTVEFEGRIVRVGAFPISIDVGEWERLSSLPTTIAVARTLRERYAARGNKLVVSVDRVDYTKGIIRRLRALEHVWAEDAERRERFTMLLVATPSRSDVPAYAELERDMLQYVATINERFGTKDWTPIVLVNENVDSDLLAAVYSAADVCLVSSLQDGMNLVAKEFIACQMEGDGALVLSRFTGAADELDGAILVNPFFIDTFADGIRAALDMPEHDRRVRMCTMRARLKRSTIHDWLGGVLGAAERAKPLLAAGLLAT